MKVSELALPGVLLVEPSRFEDPRGQFLETWQSDRYREAGIPNAFLQDNLSVSKKGVLRGLHYQYPSEQAKLVSVIDGEVFDVVVDIRRGSPSFGRWIGMNLSGPSLQQLYVPEGFAHGFVALSEVAVFSYKCTNIYSPRFESTVLWNDPRIGIDWPIKSPILSVKDQSAPLLSQIAADRLPLYVVPA